MKRLISFILAVAPFFTLPATDPLNNRTAGTLGSNWTCISGAPTDWVLTSGGGAASGYAGADFAGCYHNVDTYNNDQYGQVVITRGSSGFQGVGARFSASRHGYYVALSGGTGCVIQLWNGAGGSTIGSCAVSWTNGHTLKLGANGSTITAYDNGVSIGSATDSTITSGSPGIIGYTDPGQGFTNFEGGNLGGVGPVYPNALLLNILHIGGLRD